MIALGSPNKTQVGDMGIDGRIFPASVAPENKRGKTTGHLDSMDAWYPVQVKQKDKVGRPDIDSFEAMMGRADRTKGFFVSFHYSRGAYTEIDAFFRVIIPLRCRRFWTSRSRARWRDAPRVRLPPHAPPGRFARLA